LPHDQRSAEVDRIAYKALLKAVNSGKYNDFERIPLGTQPPEKLQKLIDPEAGLAFDLEGPDSHAVTMRPAPRIDSDEAAAEMAELYWMALLRDINFTEYDIHPMIQQAADSLSNEFPGYFQELRDSSRHITSLTVFRGITKGDLVGPYLSQFMLKGNKDAVLNREEKHGWIKYGTSSIDQRHVVAIKDIDYMTDYDNWLKVQNGLNKTVNPLNDPVDDNGDKLFDPIPRFIRNMRDLATFVHYDASYQPYLSACFYLLRLPASFDPGNPYKNSATQLGFGTFGEPHILSLVTEVATRALKAVWFQKWFVHRRLRPEAFGGLIHNYKTKNANCPISKKILNSSVLPRIFDRNKDLNLRHNRYDNGTYLLPQVFLEGSPAHPSYGAGHATVAGACVTVLKAWFDEDFPIANPVVPNHDGTELELYNGSGKNQLTVGGELNKLAANIAIGRNMAGVHYRSDYTEALKLGEAIAIGILEEQKITYTEKYSFILTKFDGRRIKV
jgi:hypothetical protein